MARHPAHGAPAPASAVALVDATIRAFVARGARAQAVLDHFAYHGPGLTFGELELGERFEWAAPIPCGQGPLIKRSATAYEWTNDRHGGVGTAEDYYRVERWGTRR